MLLCYSCCCWLTKRFFSYCCTVTDLSFLSSKSQSFSTSRFPYLYRNGWCRRQHTAVSFRNPQALHWNGGCMRLRIQILVVQGCSVTSQGGDGRGEVLLLLTQRRLAFVTVFHVSLRVRWFRNISLLQNLFKGENSTSAFGIHPACKWPPFIL